MISLRRFYVYRFPKGQSIESPRSGFELLRLTSESIDRYFSAESRLYAPFRRFQAKGAEGWAFVTGNDWVSYGWVTNCAIFMPPHLGKNLAAPMDWIFYCGTHPSFRRKGAFRSLLLEMAKGRSNTEQELYLDTLPENAASRLAVEKAGFRPSGTMWSLTLRVPRATELVWSGWNRSREHLAIECR